jgi:hypothetical protein
LDDKIPKKKKFQRLSNERNGPGVNEMPGSGGNGLDPVSWPPLLSIIPMAQSVMEPVPYGMTSFEQEKVIIWRI